MLNPEAKLNPQLFGKEIEQTPIRNGYGEGLLIAGERDPNVVVLCADLTESTRSEAFAKKFPERFFQVGVAEQNMATIAAGLLHDVVEDTGITGDDIGRDFGKEVRVV